MGNRKFSDEVIRECVATSFSIADVCRKFGWKPTGGNYNTVKRYVKELNLDTSHFTGQRSNINNANNVEREKPVEYYLTEDSYVKLTSLKHKLLKSGLKRYVCEKCGCNKWNGEQIALQLHHINGDNTDNRLENLQLLCPNCHSQTDSYCGNKNGTKDKRYYCNGCGKEIEKTATGYCDDCYEAILGGDVSLMSDTHTKKNVKIYGFCSECGKELHSKTKHGMCSSCCNTMNGKVKDRPNKEQLGDMLRNMSILSIAKKYGVTDNTIRKWCKSYGLPFRRNDIIEYRKVPH